MTASKKSKKRQRQRRQKARARARKQAVRQTETPTTSTAVTRSVGSVATMERPRPEVRPAPVTSPVEEPEPGVVESPAAVVQPLRVDAPEKAGDRRKIAAGIVAALVTAAALVGAAVVVLHPGSDGGRAEHSAARRYAPPRPLAPNSSYVETRVLSSGDLQVTHWISSRTPIGMVRLDQPRVAGLPHLEVSKVVVVGNHTHAIRSSAKSGAYYVTGARHLYVSYLLKGAVTRAPRPAGRALAVITNLDVDGVPGLTQTTHSVTGARVLNLACSAGEPEALPAPCGESGSDGWQATLEGGAVGDRVMAQLDLGTTSQP